MRILPPLMLWLALAGSSAASAETPPEESPPEEHPSSARHALAVGASLVPGLVVHGSGHWVAGHESTAYTLLIAEGLGAAGAVGGIAGLAVTGAASDFIYPLTTLTIAGVGLFFVSILADIYGTSTLESTTGRPLTVRPDLDLKVGYQFVQNPGLAESPSHFLDLGAVWNWRMLSVDASWRKGFDGDNWRLESGVAWRVLGPRPDARARTGSSLDLRLGYLHHRWGELGFIDNFGEFELDGRVDLDAFGQTLSGSFVNAHTGLAVGIHDYGFEELNPDSDTVLLGGFGFGMYLGHSRGSWGEIEAYYDHRHDGYVGGLKAPGLGSGVAGQFGMRGELEIWRDFGLGVDVAIGSAFVSRAQLIYRFGGER